VPVRQIGLTCGRGLREEEKWFYQESGSSQVGVAVSPRFLR